MKAVHGVFATKIVDFGVRFTTSVFVARLLGPSDRGILTFASLVVNWTVMFGNFTLTEATIFLLNGGKVSAQTAAATLGLFSALAGTVYAVVLACLVHFGVVHWPVGDVGLFMLLLTLVPVALMTNNLMSVLQALRRYNAYNAFMLLRSALALVCIGVAAVAGQFRLLAVGWAMVIAAALHMLALLIYIGRMSDWKFDFSGGFFVAAWKYGIRGHLSVILANITLRFDQFVLGALLPPSYLGWYSTAANISELPQLLPDSISVVLLPKVAGDPAGAAAVTARACRSTVLVMIGVSLVLGLIAPVVIPLIYGQAFAPTVQALWYLLPSIVFLSISKVLTKYIYGVGRPTLCIWSTAASAIVTAAMIFPMVKHYGMIGAGITSSCAYAAGALVDLTMTVRLSATRVGEFLLPRRPDFSYAALFR